MSAARKLGRAAMWPLRRILDPRFADTARRIDYSRERVLVDAQERSLALARLRDELGAFGATSNEALAFVGVHIRELETSLLDTADRFGALEQRMDELREALDAVTWERRVSALVEGGPERLDTSTSRLLNFAESHVGFASQRGLWLNPPLTLSYREGSVEVGSVNERIVEVPFAFRALGDVEPPARVLDVGSVESTVALSLASLGHRVSALDLRPYPFQHPNLEVVVSRLEDYDPGDARFDAILCISTVEHVGLGWYGEQKGQADADREALARLRAFTKPAGRLVLTVPFGEPSVDEVQRVYDDAGLDRLLEGWEELERRTVAQLDDRTWSPGSAREGQRGVALVVARRSAA